MAKITLTYNYPQEFRRTKEIVIDFDDDLNFDEFIDEIVKPLMTSYGYGADLIDKLNQE